MRNNIITHVNDKIYLKFTKISIFFQGVIYMIKKTLRQGRFPKPERNFIKRWWTLFVARNYSFYRTFYRWQKVSHFCGK